jgi:adenine/guanine phosphoribosyltransferase-like PRPP-binding protein
VHLSLQADHLSESDHVLIVDDWIETGSHLAAAWSLIEACGASVVGASACVDDVRDEGIRERFRIFGLVRSSELPGSDMGRRR